MNLFENKSLNIGVKSLAWLISVFFLKLLVENILQLPSGVLTFSYSNDFIFLISVVAVLGFAIMSGAWIYNKELEALKY